MQPPAGNGATHEEMQEIATLPPHFFSRRSFHFLSASSTHSSSIVGLTGMAKGMTKGKKGMTPLPERYHKLLGNLGFHFSSSNAT